jgi:hypothetical protein
MNQKMILTLLGLACITNCQAESEQIPKKRVLIGSPIRQKPAILKEFLQSLLELNTNSFEADYLFVDDNNDPESSLMLNSFGLKLQEHCIIMKYANSAQDSYVCNERTHYWHEKIIWKVAHFKNCMIDYAVEHSYDYLFLIDSDIVLNPKTIDRLIETKKDIVANIFWTQWQPENCKLPQVWLMDEYKFYISNTNEQLSPEEINARTIAFLQPLLSPGTYEVGGLGACTLLSQKALRAGVSFRKIKNLTFWGEDRHFCIRAAALGIDLFVDTFYPAYHIYRETDLSGVPLFKTNCANDIYQI